MLAGCCAITCSRCVDRLVAAAETRQRLAERMARARVVRRRRHDQLQQRQAARGVAVLDQQDGQQQAGIVVLAAARQNPLARRARGRAVALIVVADRVRHRRHAAQPSAPPALIDGSTMPVMRMGRQCERIPVRCRLRRGLSCRGPVTYIYGPDGHDRSRPPSSSTPTPASTTPSRSCSPSRRRSWRCSG